MRRLIRLGVIIGAGVLAAGCSAGAGSTGSSGSSGSAGSGGSTGKASASSELTLDNENGALWTCDFNPYNQAQNFLSVGFAYEPLVYVDPLQSGKTTPMLATSWSWGAGNKSLTFQIRKGVEFSNGEKLTAADVAYTFNLLKTSAGMDINGLWGSNGVLSSVTATGPYTVTMDFTKVAVPYFYYIADQTPILPQAVWSKYSNPASNAVTAPIGSGPYVMTKCSPENIVFTANPHYWQPGLPKIHTLEYPAYTSNNTANNDLANGQAQWGSQYIPSIQAFYTSKSPDYHYWFPPTVNVSLIPNLDNPLLSNIKVRQAISYAINRTQVSNIGESGYEPPANQTGIVTPTFNSEESSAAVSAWGTGYDPSKATQLLNQAGFHMGAGGIMTNAAGQQLKFTVINVGDYSDWVASMQVIQQDLKAIGISITPDNLSSTDFSSDLDYGKYQLAYYDQQIFGPSAYYELNNWLNSADTAPVGKQSGTNYERYSSPATDALLNQYQTTTSTATQQSILNQIQQVMITQVPFIPVVEAVDWFQYDSASDAGWPTPSNPYAQPSIYAYPDNEQVLLRLSPTG
jgi:peptide/nickel transport system substrate-binding protein